MKIPAPHSSAGHSRLSRLIFPLSSTYNLSFSSDIPPKDKDSYRLSYLVVLELSKMGSLVLVLDLLGGRVVLLLPLLRASSQPDIRVAK